MPVRPLLQTLRPHQWVKNLFVLAPLVFSKHLFSGPHILLALAAFALFCVGSGVVYLVNDLVDVERDRQHPVKCRRPIASGELSLGSARLAAAILGPGALLGAYATSPELTLVLAGYMALNLFYSIVLKHLPYVDVLSIAAGFLLRVVGGAMAVHVVPSFWLLLCTGLLATYTGLGKRAHELSSLGDKAPETRAVLGRYNLEHVKWVMLLTALATLVGYTLYTLAPATVRYFGTRFLAATVPFPAFGIFRFFQLVTRPHEKSSPTDEMLKDPPFLVNLALYAAAVVVTIYLVHA
jgi:decaprenyl-phosphate phosphoribosyltransferase